MSSHFLLTRPRPSPASCCVIPLYQQLPKSGGCFNTRNSSRNNKFPLKLVVVKSLGDKWKLSDIDTSSARERLNLWLSKTQNFLNEVTAPLIKPGQDRTIFVENTSETKGMEEIFIAEPTIDRRTPNGNLSLAAIVSIEQFSRMNGLTGKKMKNIFETLVSQPLCNDARNLVEYCCFRFLSRDSSAMHPCLKEPAFQKLIFITMLAWQQPYNGAIDLGARISDYSLERKLVGEQAFVRIAPAVAGVADRSTVHNLFKALSGDEEGISLNLWTTYIKELLKVHDGRRNYKIQESPSSSTERILCIGSNRKPPVLKWENNLPWPGKLTLTDTALYFEEIGLKSQKEPIRMDLTKDGSRVEKTRVGPLGSLLFDSAVTVSSGSDTKAWILEFVDFGGEMRRDLWHAFISEVISLYEFIREYGPECADQSLAHVYGANRGKERAITSAINSITRLQATQFTRKLSDDPIKLVQFSYLRNAPFGNVVFQALAVNFWGGPLVPKYSQVDHPPAQGTTPLDEISGSGTHVFDVDGSVYLRKWMRSPSWESSTSSAFWKNSSLRKGVVLSKNLVVADMSLVERAAITCKEKSQAVEKTQATINAAMIKGIPSNIDLFKELLLPLTITVKNIQKLRRWEEPHLTVCFLAVAYTVIFRNMLSYVFPVTLIIMAAVMLSLKGLKEQGRLGRSFGTVTIRDQPPSNTIQKIIAVKEAMLDVEKYLQNLNVALLKIRTIVLSTQPKITSVAALVLLFSASVLLIVPFRYILAFLLLDLFTQELDFRKQMVRRFINFLKERWTTVPAAPVVVLPYENDETMSDNLTKETGHANPENK